MQYSAEEKAKWIEDWRGSGKNAWSYAKEKGLKQQTFAKWVKKEKEAECGFVEIQAKAASMLETTRIVIEKGDMKVHIPLGASGKELGTIIESLRGHYDH